MKNDMKKIEALIKQGRREEARELLIEEWYAHHASNNVMPARRRKVWNLIHSLA